MSRIFTRGTTTLIVCSHGIALFLEHMDDEQEPKISSEISPHINDKQLGRLNSYDIFAGFVNFIDIGVARAGGECQRHCRHHKTKGFFHIMISKEFGEYPILNG